MALKAKNKKLVNKSTQRSVLSSHVPVVKSKKQKSKNSLKPNVALPSVSKKQKKKTGGKIFIDNCELPVSYNRTGITLIARDPCSIFAYWDVTASSLKAAQSDIGGTYKKATQTLRIYDLTGSETEKKSEANQFDIDIDPGIFHRYINLTHDNATVFAELGMRTKKGAFYPLARSNRISTPCANESDCLDITWCKVKHPQGSKPSIVARAFGDSSSEIKGIHPSMISQIINEREDTGQIRQSVDLHHEDATQTIENESENALQPIKEKLNATIVSNETTLHAPRPLLQGGSSENAYVKNDMQSYFSEMNAGASSEIFQGGASELAQDRNNFFFNVNAELIVYGKTQPGALVTLDGQPVFLRDDGTFSMRMALPEGDLPLAFSAQSSQRNCKKSVLLIVNRTTR